MSKLTLRAQTVDIAYLPLRQDLLAKNVLMTAQRDLRLGNSLLVHDLIQGENSEACLDMWGSSGRNVNLCIPLTERGWLFALKNFP